MDWNIKVKHAINGGYATIVTTNPLDRINEVTSIFLTIDELEHNLKYLIAEIVKDYHP